jgi:hypothetical protein
MIPEQDRVQKGIVVPERIRDKALQPAPETFIRFVIVPGFIRNLPSSFFSFWKPFVNHTIFIDKPEFTNVPINSPGRNAGDKIAVIDNAITSNLISVPEFDVTDSGRAQGVSSGGMRIPVGRQGCKGSPQAVSAKPDWKALPV